MSKGTVFRRGIIGARYIEVSPWFLFRVGLKTCLTYLAGDVAQRRPSDPADG